jgi:hypothetical protein
MSKKHHDREDIEVSRFMKKQFKNGRQNKKHEKGWRRKVPTYRKPVRYENEFIPIGNGRYRVIEVEKKRK